MSAFNIPTLRARVEISAELVTDSKDHQYDIKKLQVLFHCTNLLSGQLVVEQNRIATCKAQEVTVDEYVLKALNEYGTTFTIASNSSIAADATLANSFITFNNTDIQVPSVYNTHDMVLQQIEQLSQEPSFKPARPTDSAPSMPDMSSGKVIPPPIMVTKREPAKTANTFQFQLDLKKLKLLNTESYMQVKQQMTVKGAFNAGTVALTKKKFHAMKNFGKSRHHRHHGRHRAVHFDDEANKTGAGGDKAHGSDEGFDSDEEAVVPMPHHYNHPDFHLEYDGMDRHGDTDKIIRDMHKKMMLNAKKNIVLKDQMYKADEKVKPIFMRHQTIQRVLIPAVYEEKKETKAEKKVIDYSKSEWATANTKQVKERKTVKKSTKEHGPQEELQRQNMHIQLMNSSMQKFKQANSLLAAGPKEKFWMNVAENDPNKKMWAYEHFQLDTDFLYKRDKNTYRKNRNIVLTGVYDNVKAPRAPVSEKITISWAPLLLGQTEMSRVYSLRASSKVKLKITIKIQGEWLTPQLVQALKPVHIHIKDIHNLPETPVKQKVLATKCKPVYTIIKAFGLEIPCYAEQKPHRGHLIPFSTGKVLFLGLLRNGSIREQLMTEKLVVEVHDRDLRRHVEDSTEQLATYDEFPYGIATFDMKQLLSPGSLHVQKVPIVPSRSIHSQIQQGHYIENGATLTVELATPFPFFQTFKIKQLSLKDRAGKFQKIIVYGSKASMSAFLKSTQDAAKSSFHGAFITDGEFGFVLVESTSDILRAMKEQAAFEDLHYIYDERYVVEQRVWKELLLQINLPVPVDQFITNVKIHIKNNASFESLQFLSHLQMLKESVLTQVPINFKPVVQYLNEIHATRFNELAELAHNITSTLNTTHMYRSQIFGSMFAIDKKRVLTSAKG